MKSLFLTTWLLLAIWSMAAAKSVDLPGEGASIDIPDGWVSASTAGTALSYSDAQKSSAMAIVVFPNDRNLVIGPDFVHGMEEGIVGQGSKIGATVSIVSEKPTTLNGVSSYLIQSKTVLANSRTIYAWAYPIAANGKIYAISLQSLDPGKDAELAAVANSFRFANPPELPDPSRNSAAYKVGYSLGGLIALLALFLILRLLFRAVFRRKS